MMTACRSPTARTVAVASGQCRDASRLSAIRESLKPHRDRRRDQQGLRQDGMRFQAFVFTGR
jgi:hypothetical protein